MKTKRIEIEISGLRSLDYDKMDYILRLSNEQFDLIKQHHMGSKKVILTFEVPLPEPEVSITPSRIDEIYFEYRLTPNPGIRWRDFLKRKLFPDWEG